MKRVAVLAVLVAAVLTAVYAVLTYYDEFLKIGRMWETPGVKPHEEEILVMPAGVMPASGGEALYRATVGAELLSPLDLNDPASVLMGEKVYFTYCAQCHGKYHDGNGTVGQSFAPLPTDLKSEKVQQLSSGELFKNISYGIPNGRQPPLATTVELNDRWRVIAYVKSLGIRQ